MGGVVDMRQVGWIGGVGRRRDALAVMSATTFRQAVDAGSIRRLRHGWYATGDAHPDVVRAVAAGGALASVSALAWHGIWVPSGCGLHVRRPDDLLARPLPAGLHDCRLHKRLPVRRAVDNPALAWRTALECIRDVDLAVAMTDSALHLGKIQPDLLAGLGGRLSNVARWADGRCESGTESVVRVRLLRRGIKVTPQFVVPGVGRHDLLVGERLILECDSRAHHTDPTSYQRDRWKDRTLVALGYLPMRLTVFDVFHDWERASAPIFDVVRAGKHLWPRKKTAPRGSRSAQRTRMVVRGGRLAG